MLACDMTWGRQHKPSPHLTFVRLQTNAKSACAAAVRRRAGSPNPHRRCFHMPHTGTCPVDRSSGFPLVGSMNCARLESTALPCPNTAYSAPPPRQAVKRRAGLGHAVACRALRSSLALTARPRSRPACALRSWLRAHETKTIAASACCPCCVTPSWAARLLRRWLARP